MFRVAAGSFEKGNIMSQAEQQVANGIYDRGCTGAQFVYQGDGITICKDHSILWLPLDGDMQAMTEASVQQLPERSFGRLPPRRFR